MRIAVLPNNDLLRGRHFDARIMLFGQPDGPSVGSVGAQVVPEAIRGLKRPASQRAWDLTALAMAVIAADRHVSRVAVSPDGWSRVLDLTVAVTDPRFWEPLRPLVERMLRFLTGDLWTVEFVAGGVHPAPPRRAIGRRSETCVSLLSGGLDSLIGAIDLHAEKAETPLFVANRVHGDCQRQMYFAAQMGATQRLLTLNHNARTQANAEISQRPRSLAFIAFGVLAATALDRYEQGTTVDVNVPENGFISLNVPLTPLRAGSLSTRTTHPIFMAEMQELLDALGLHVRLVNRYKFRTKGEMMVECRDQEMLARLASHSMSCGRGGRINRHCGQCLPCLVRRGAFLHHTGAVNLDRTTRGYKSPHPPAAFQQQAFREYDDVMQCLQAVDTLNRHGARRWIGPSITATKVPNPEPYRGVAVRGLREIQAFLHAVGLV